MVITPIGAPPMTNSSSNIQQESALVHLRLPRAGHSIASTIEEINGACDLAEDAGPSTAMVVHIRDSVRQLAMGSMDMPLFGQWERALKRIETLRAPTVCVINGACFGLMLEVMLCTDYRVATDRLQVGLAHMADTLWPSMAIHRLATQLGVAQARALVLFDQSISSDKAVGLGLIHSISNDPMSTAHVFIASLEAAGVQDVSIRRQLLLEAVASSHESALGTHMVGCSRALRREAAQAAAASPAVALENR
jgi:isomerase DpgB